MYQSSELIINEDGSVFHLHLKPGQIAGNIILVGDRARSAKVAAFFDSVDCDVQNREFHSITGTYKGKRISVISTGIGVGNIDIAINELDALANIDFSTREDFPVRKCLNMVRIGTSGGLQPYTPEGTFVASECSFGFDGLPYFYNGNDSVRDKDAEEAFLQQCDYPANAARPYCVHSDKSLLDRIAQGMVKGGTICAQGFYAPQGRQLRYGLSSPCLNEQIRRFDYHGMRICNMEMESAALSALASIYGHKALTVCLIIANRYGKSFIGDYNPLMEKLIRTVLDRI